MTSDGRVQVTPQLVIGVFIMLAGILLTLDRLQIVDAAFTVRLWPAVFIAAGLWLLVSRKGEPKARFWGSFWTFLGSWWLLNSLGIVRVGFWQLVWPIALTWLGFSLIRQTLGRGTQSGVPGDVDKINKWIHERFTDRSGASGKVTLFALMGEAKRSVTDEAFRGGEMTSFMGGCRLDLRQAVMAPGEEATINVFAMMGGHEVWVPNGWNVVSNILPVMGGVDDKRLPAIRDAAAPTDARPRLLLRGVVFMGGIVIKS